MNKNLLQLNQKNNLKQEIFAGNIDYLQDFFNNNNIDINSFDQEYKTLLDYACISGNFKTISFLLGHNARIGTLFYIMNKKKDFEKLINILSRTKYDFNQCDKLGFSLTHYLFSLDYQNSLNKVISLGAKIDNIGFNGKMALEYQNSHTNDKIIGLVIGRA